MASMARCRWLGSPVSLPLLLLGWLLVAPVGAAAEDLFFDDFESYPVGTLPAVW